MQDNICQHEMWFAGVLDEYSFGYVNCRCLDCGFKQVINIEEADRNKLVTVNEKFNSFKPVSFEMAQETYQKYKEENPFSAKMMIKRKYR